MGLRIQKGGHLRIFTPGVSTQMFLLAGSSTRPTEFASLTPRSYVRWYHIKITKKGIYVSILLHNNLNMYTQYTCTDILKLGTSNHLVCLHPNRHSGVIYFEGLEDDIKPVNRSRLLTDGTFGARPLYFQRKWI